MNIVDQYSGIIINQNQKPVEASDFLTITDGLWRYQEVFLPTDYVRGTAENAIIPPLSGWQLFVGVDAGSQETASLEWTAEYRIFGIGWVTMASGVTVGIHSEGNRVWMDLPFTDPVDMNSDLIDKRMRFGFRNISGVNKVWYSNPNPLALQGFVKLYAADGVTAIQDSGADISVLFRVLGLTIDSGIDFLGNPYRSALRSNVSDNTSIVDGSKIDKIFMSEPAPSRFAVKNLYYDVRTPSPISYGKQNYIPNPSFEIGTTGYNAYQNGGTGTLTITSEVPAFSGNSCGKLTATSAISDLGAVSLPNLIPVIPGQTWSISGYSRAATISRQVIMIVAFYTAADVFLFSTAGTPTANIVGAWKRANALTVAIPATAAKMAVYISHNGLANGEVHYIDALMAIKAPTISNYFDGDYPGYQWTRDPHNSPSIEVIEGTIVDDQSVIDNVLVDPVTPGVWFSVYYSSEGDRPTSEDEWENKLWTRVPGSFQALKRESYKLPQPILAKYIKIEFTHLQARSYNPGDFAKPVAYKKHPKWVLDYFLARLASERQLTNQLSTQRIGVVYDAFDIAYNYYLDDLKQEPEEPVEVNPGFSDSLDSFLGDTTDASDQVDATVIERINLAMNPYKTGLTSFMKNNYLPTLVSQATDTGIQSPGLERDAPGTDVGVLRNTEVVQENDYPVMFFFLTCRHKYREIVAPFSHNRAYFVGIREIAFTREHYTVAYDNDQYIEPAGDLLNVERNDFVQDNGTLTI